jgi:hypothetical protein
MGAVTRRPSMDATDLGARIARRGARIVHMGAPIVRMGARAVTLGLQAVRPGSDARYPGVATGEGRPPPAGKRLKRQFDPNQRKSLQPGA